MHVYISTCVHVHIHTIKAACTDIQSVQHAAFIYEAFINEIFIYETFIYEPLLFIKSQFISIRQSKSFFYKLSFPSTPSKSTFITFPFFNSSLTGPKQPHCCGSV